MNLDDVRNIATIIGVTFAGLSAVIAVLTYLRAYLQKQADLTRELLFLCERDFRTVYREFDQVGLVRTANQVISHPRMKALATEVWNVRSKPIKELNKVLDLYKQELSVSVLQALASGSLSDYDKEFQQALYKLRPRYPVLHLFLRQIHGLMRYAVNLSRKPETYHTLITEGLQRMHKNGDLSKMPQPESVLSFVYGIIMLNLGNKVEEQRLNDLFRSLYELIKIFFSHYLDRSDFRLWTLSKTERRAKLEALQNKKVSQTLKGILSLKSAYFSQDQFTQAAYLIGNAEAILTDDHQD